jgi:predicted nucleotidyltransferase
MSRSLLAGVAATLDAAGIRFAVIGAGALAAHGIARSTFDLDLFTTDVAALEQRTWAGIASDSGIQLDLRRGDSSDPLAGLVRLTTAGERDIDVVVGRLAWQTEVVQRAIPVESAGVRLPVVTAADLILLKLYAGGSQDSWDIEQLLTRDDRDAIIETVNSRIGPLSRNNHAAWARISTR